MDKWQVFFVEQTDEEVFWGQWVASVVGESAQIDSPATELDPTSDSGNMEANQEGDGETTSSDVEQVSKTENLHLRTPETSNLTANSTEGDDVRRITFLRNCGQAVFDIARDLVAPSKLLEIPLGIIKA
ncbi:UNVERIFIED_CONTAM: hypothetical protein K2H54_061789 [Gekko kuhli]